MRGVGDLSFVEMYGLLAANAWLPPCPKDRFETVERSNSICELSEIAVRSTLWFCGIPKFFLRQE